MLRIDATLGLYYENPDGLLASNPELQTKEDRWTKQRHIGLFGTANRQLSQDNRPS